MLTINNNVFYYRDQGHIVQEFDFLWDPEKFTFTYIMNGEVYELYDGQQILYPCTVLVLVITCWGYTGEL